MAQLPPDGEWLVQQVEGKVYLFQRYTEFEVASWDAGDQDSIGPALKVINDSKLLNDEQKSLAAFWAGYFYAHARST